MRNSVRSVERALDLMAALETADHRMGVSELSRVTGVPKATAQRLLSVLEGRGFVQKEWGRYEIGARVVSMARAFQRGNGLVATTMPVLEELAVLSGETVSLLIRQGFDRVVVQRVDSPHPLRYTIRIGQRLPLHVGAAGVVLASAMPEEELQQLLDRLGEIRLATGETLTRDDWLAKLERVRRQGFAVSVEEREIGVVSIAAPVVVPARGTVAAIAVSGPPSRMSQEKIEYLIVEVRRAAQEIADSYGRV